MATLLAFFTPALLALLPGRLAPAPSRSPPPRATESNPWPSKFSTHIVRGISTAVSEATAEGGLRGGVKAGARIARLVVNELFIFPVQMVPFAVRTVRYRSPNVESIESPSIEVYSKEGASDGPLVLYFHGGSWGQGAPWQYALLARRFLEESGASRVALARYRLFPEGDVDDMLADVEAALDWCRMQQEQAACSNPSAPKLRVVLAAQSAGAHLCALYLARRGWRGSDEGGSWLPDRFVALSGVFDIAAHFAHERTRLVHWLSPMWLAMIGRGVASNAQASKPLLDAEESQLVPIDDLKASAAAAGGEAEWSEDELIAWAAASPTRLLRLRKMSKKAPKGAEWPPTVVLHAADDGTVPVRSAREFVEALESTGLSPDVRYVEYERAGHGEIMVSLMSPRERDEEGVRDIGRAFVRSIGE